MASGREDWTLTTTPTVITADKFDHGLDADKAASPEKGQVYYATDTKVLYLCAVAGTWSGISAASLVTGILTLYSNMNANSKKITGLAAPTAANDAARKAYVDTVDAKLDDISTSKPSRAIDTEYQNGSKLRLVIISVRLDAGEGVTIQMGASSPPTGDYVEAVSVTTRTDVPLTIFVNPSWYYKLLTDAGSPSVVYWTEQDLF